MILISGQIWILGLAVVFITAGGMVFLGLSGSRTELVPEAVEPDDSVLLRVRREQNNSQGSDSQQLKDPFAFQTEQNQRDDPRYLYLVDEQKQQEKVNPERLIPFSLKGIICSVSGNFLLIELRENPRLVAEGQTIDGYTIEEIKQEQVVISYQRQTIEIPVRGD